MIKWDGTLDKAGTPLDFGPIRDRPTPAPAQGQYTNLIQKLFQKPAAITLIGGSAAETTISPITESLAAELASQGKRVVIVPVTNLLRQNPIPIPEDSSFQPTQIPHVWQWPTAAGQKIEFFKPTIAPAGNWLDALRRNFQAVLLDCPHVHHDQGIAEIAAMSDAAVLVVEAGITAKVQIQQDQRALQLRGITVQGCILAHSK